MIHLYTMQTYPKVSYNLISSISSKHKMSNDALDLLCFYRSTDTYESVFLSLSSDSPQTKEEQLLCHSYCKEMHHIFFELETQSLEDSINKCRRLRDTYQLKYDLLCDKYNAPGIMKPFREIIIFDEDIYVTGGESDVEGPYTHESIKEMDY